MLRGILGVTYYVATCSRVIRMNSLARTDYRDNCTQLHM
jgi:hypothetical protein